MAKKHKIHFLPSHRHITTACRKYGLFDYDLIEKNKMTKAQQLEIGGTYIEAEVTCEYCIKEILLERYKAGKITL